LAAKHDPGGDAFILSTMTSVLKSAAKSELGNLLDATAHPVAYLELSVNQCFKTLVPSQFYSSSLSKLINCTQNLVSKNV
jgi:hypothetical protein